MRKFRPATALTSAAQALSRVIFGLSLLLTLAVAGCRSTGDLIFSKMKEDQGSASEDPWTTQAGSEGRAGRAVEKEADPLNLRRFLMSEKAMEIERNCGFE